MANNDLLQRTLAHIEAHPDEWEQRHWTRNAPGCGTSHCFAGHAIALTYPTTHFDAYSDAATLPADADAPNPGISVPEYAGELLDLTSREADVLFSARNTLDDLRQMVTDLIAGGRIEYAHDEDDDEYEYEDES